MKVYHFLKDDMTSSYGNEPAWKVGEKRTIKGKINLCSRGYHSSPSWYDALQYAPGSMACIVEVSKPVEQKNDKQVSHSRKLITAKDASRVLRLFACDCAERALKVAKVTDEHSWNEVKVSRDYANGKATDEELYVVWYAARAAARAARAAARAARAAARAAARDAEIRWQKRRLNKLMGQLFKEAHNVYKG